MAKWLHFTLVSILLIPLVAYTQQTGKIVGTLLDSETGEPIPGANITIEYATLGATSDLDGYFIILNVPVGLNSVRTQYIGYRDVLLNDVRVYANTTSDVKIEMEPTTLELTETIEIVAVRPLVEKNFTHSYSAITADEIENISVRGLENILDLQAGIVVQDGNVYIRGGRANQTGYYIDGSSITSPYDNNRSLSVIQNAVEEIQVLTGGYPAEYGGAVSGIMLAELKTGTPRLNLSFEAQTDNFAGNGERFLNTYSYGHSIITATIATPLFSNNIRMFAAIENEYIADWRKRWSNGYRFENLVDTDIKSRTYGDTIPVIEYPNGFTPLNNVNNWRINSTFLIDFNPIQFRINGIYSTSIYSENGAPMLDILNDRKGMFDKDELLLGIKFSHILNAKTFYNIKINYFEWAIYREDSYFGRDWRAWGDSTRVADHTNNQITYESRWDPGSYMDLAGFPFTHNGDPPFNSYIEQKRKYIGGIFSFISQFNKYNELKGGLEFSYHTIRRYGVYFEDFMKLADFYGSEQAVPDNELADVFRGITIGYDFRGNEIDQDQTIEKDGIQVTGPQGPAHPIFASAYLQDKIEFGDLIINAGLRFDYVDSDTKNLINPANPPVIQSLNTIADSGWTKTEPVYQFSPRLGIAFPISERTVFYAQYGKFMQMVPLLTMFGNRFIYGNNIVNGFSSYAGADINPISSIQYEIGFRHQLSSVSAFSIVGFYKNTKNQLDRTRVEVDVFSDITSYAQWQNRDFSTIKGLEFEFKLRRIRRIQLRFNYTLTSAEGSGSDSWSPDTKNVFPLDYEQRHKGNLHLNYRFADNDGGPILENLGLDLIFKFNSGHPYTADKMLVGSSDNGWLGSMARDSRGRSATEPVNSSITPWVSTLDLRLDKSLRLWQALWINIYIRINNVLNSQNTINVYRTTGSANDDGWLRNSDNYSQFESRYGQTYIDMYRALNLENGQGYLYATGNELYGTPRQIWFGLKITYAN